MREKIEDIDDYESDDDMIDLFEIPFERVLFFLFFFVFLFFVFVFIYLFIFMFFYYFYLLFLFFFICYFHSSPLTHSSLSSSLSPLSLPPLSLPPLSSPPLSQKKQSYDICVEDLGKMHISLAIMKSLLSTDYAVATGVFRISAGSAELKSLKKVWK